MKIFIVEDDEWYCEYISYNLLLDEDHNIEKFHTGQDCLSRLGSKPDIITLDYRVPDMTGEEILRKIKEFDPEIEVVVISEQNKIETAVMLLKQGAFDYIVKSKNIKDQLLSVLRNIKKQKKLERKINALQKEVERKYEFENIIIGTSPAIKNVYTLIQKAIESNIPVTITGETGTGKELVARAIHYNSGRRKEAFTAINMAAIPKDLVESELFGHEKGAFTGAQSTRIGKFEEAGEGTLFLDEIGEMDLNMQAKLLRVLQEKEITRIGSNKVINIKCRIIVASNKNLRKEVRTKKFRNDLYYRLFGLTIDMPPLRERGKDILLLAKFFIRNYSEENGLEIKKLTPSAQEKLLNYQYPGNIRELKSVIELAIIMSDGDEIHSGDITFGGDEFDLETLNYELTLKEHNERIIKAYLGKYNGNVKSSAEKLGIGFSTIYRMLKKK